MTTTEQLIPLAAAVLDVTTAERVPLIAPSLDVRPEWCSPEVAALYKEWQALRRAEDRAEWAKLHTVEAPNLELLKAIQAHTQKLLHPRDAVSLIRESWYHERENAQLRALTSATKTEDKMKALNLLQSLYGATESQAYFVDLTNPPQENEPMLVSDGIGFGFRCEVTAVKAKAKSGKTHLAKVIASDMITAGTPMKFHRPERDGEEAKPRRVLFIDTEQSKRASYKLTRDICRMAGYATDQPCPMLHTVNLRGLSTDERLPFIKGIIGGGEYDCLILDGIKDIAKDINDNIEADRILNDITNMAETYNIAIITVLHENPAKDTDKMRGHLGTELLNKAHDVFEISLDKKTGTFNILHTDSREKPIAPWAFHFVPNDPPDGYDHLEICEPTQTGEEGQGQGQKSKVNIEEQHWFQIVKAFEDGDYNISYTKEDLVKQLAKKCDIKETTAKNRIKNYYNKGFLKTDTGTTKPGSRYYISPDKLTEFKTRLTMGQNDDENLPF